MQFSPENPLITFYTLPRIANRPARADRSAMGTLPTRAYRYCDAVTTAAGLGWYVYPPCEFWLFYTGDQVLFRLPDMAEWRALESIRFPGLTERFDRHCPEALRNKEPPFLSAIREPGVVQIWTGLLARTAPGWSINLRRPANLPPLPGYFQYEAVLETDHWFGALFTNIQLHATGREVHFDPKNPLIQLVPIPQLAYAEAIQNATPENVTAIPDWSAADWAAYDDSFVANAGDDRTVGKYAVEVRRRRRSGCPMHHQAEAAA